MTLLCKETLQTFLDLPIVFTEFLALIPDDKLDRKRGDPVWTIREHFYHLVDVQEMLLGRILKIKNETNPLIEAFFPENEEISAYVDINEALTSYRTLREKQYNVVKNLSKKELEKRGIHKGYELYTIPVIVRHMIAHEYWHMYRMEEIAFIRDEFFNND